MQSVIDGTRSKTLRFKHHATIENTLVKLKAMYNPLKRFAQSIYARLRNTTKSRDKRVHHAISGILPKGIVLAS